MRIERASVREQTALSKLTSQVVCVALDGFTGTVQRIYGDMGFTGSQTEGLSGRVRRIQ